VPGPVIGTTIFGLDRLNGHKSPTLDRASSDYLGA
jgi:hypothetical protein